MIQGNIETTDLKYPAATICPKISTKYAIAERLGNYIDPLNLPEELLSLRHDFLTCAFGLSKMFSKYNVKANNNFPYRLDKQMKQPYYAVYKVIIEIFKKLYKN